MKELWVHPDLALLANGEGEKVVRDALAKFAQSVGAFEAGPGWRAALGAA